MNAIHLSFIRTAAKPRRWQFAHWLMAIFTGMTLLLACTKDKSMTAPENIFIQSDEIVYFNSFESSQDTIGWQGISQTDLKSEAPAKGGKRSLYISGGCTHPHASLVLPLRSNDGYFIIQCWGKDLGISGSVELNIEGNELQPGIGMQINKPNWEFYRSADTLYCPANRRLKLMLSSGGFVASAMLVDLIEIIKVKTNAHSTTTRRRLYALDVSVD